MNPEEFAKRSAQLTKEYVARQLEPLQKQLEALEARLAVAEDRGFRYRGTWSASTQFNDGDAVSHDGSLWLAKASTRDRPGTSPHWQLIVKRGRDGRDAR
jgi:hypothetical protein